MTNSIAGKTGWIKGIFSLFLFLLMGGGVLAQTQTPQQPKANFSDQELEAFVDAFVLVNEVQKETQTALQEAIEAENLDLARFNEIARAGANPQDSVSFSEEEILAFNNAAKQVKVVQQETQAKIQEILTAEELSQEKFQQIVVAYQQNPAIQEKVTKMLQEKMYGSGE